VSMGDGSPGSREAEGEGGEGFYIGRCPDLLVILGGDSGEDGSMLPFLFWRVSIERRCSPPSGAPGVIPSPVSHPGCCPERQRDAFIFGPITLLTMMLLPGVHFRPY
jgi:hypothetical protein